MRQAVLLTEATPDILPLCTGLLDNKREYAKAWGLDFVCNTTHFARTWHSSYCKVPLIKTFLKRYDEVYWIDMDVCFTNFRRNIRDVLTAGRSIGAFDEGHCLCAGWLLLRSNDYSRALFADLSLIIKGASHEARMKHPWEQTAFNTLYRLQTDAEKAAHWQLLTVREIGAFWQESYYIHRSWLPGDLTIHMGVLPWAERARIWHDKYKKQVVR